MLCFKKFLNIITEKSDNTTTKGVSVTGVHYSHKAGLTHLDGSKFGTGMRSAESRRLADTKDTRIQKRSYFYNKADHEVLPKMHETGLGPHAYEAHLTKMYHIDHATDAERTEVSAHKAKHMASGESAPNAFERAVVDSGFNGYTNGHVSIVFNHDKVPVKYLGHRNEILNPTTAVA